MNYDLSAQLERFIDKHGLSYSSNSVSYVFDCPRCLKPKLYMYKDSGRFTCWVCAPDGAVDGFSGRPEYALSELAQVSVEKVKKFLYGDKPLTNASEWVQASLAMLHGIEEDGDLEIPIVPISWEIDWKPIDHPHAAKGEAYLRTRGISQEIAVEYGIRYSPPKRSIAFPVTFDSKLIGYQTRVTFDVSGTKTPKSLTSEGLPRERVVMFEDRITADHAILLEGPTDAIKTRLCGGGVATLGKKVSRKQIERLAHLGVRRFYLGQDADAWQESNRLNQELNGFGFEVRAMRAPAGYEDHGAAPEDLVLDVFKKAPIITPSYVFAPW